MNNNFLPFFYPTFQKVHLSIFTVQISFHIVKKLRTVIVKLNSNYFREPDFKKEIEMPLLINNGETK